MSRLRCRQLGPISAEPWGTLCSTDLRVAPPPQKQQSQDIFPPAPVCLRSRAVRGGASSLPHTGQQALLLETVLSDDRGRYGETSTTPSSPTLVKNVF